MELILKQTIDTLGREGDVVKVKPGYGRNYLLPKGMAVQASKANLALLERERESIEARRSEEKSRAQSLAAKIAETTVVIQQRVGEEDRLYGSVTNADLAESLAAQGIEIDRKKILLEEPIKTLGVKTVPVKVGYQMMADLKVEIVPLAGE